MKCEHGKEVTVSVDPIDPQWWDDGVKTHKENRDIKTIWDHDGADFLCVEGCADCKTIRME